MRAELAAVSFAQLAVAGVLGFVVHIRSGPVSSARAEANLSRLRRENTDLRRTLALYEEAIRQLTLENDALRRGATVLPLRARA